MRRSIFLILSSTCALTLTLLISILSPTTAVAQELKTRYTHVQGGDECHVMNPTTKNAASLRKADGTIRNISDPLTATVVCPLPIATGGQSISDDFRWLGWEGKVQVFFLNFDASEEQRFRCNLYLPGSQVYALERRIWKQTEILQDSTGSLEIEGIYRLAIAGGVDILRPPALTCGLPPRSAILSVLIDAVTGEI